MTRSHLPSIVPRLSPPPPDSFVHHHTILNNSALPHSEDCFGVSLVDRQAGGLVDDQVGPREDRSEVERNGHYALETSGGGQEIHTQP